MECKFAAFAAAVLLSFAAPAALRAQEQSSQSQSQQSDPVAEAARKTREQKKEAAKPKKVYTNDDIKPAQPVPGEQAPPAPSQPPAGQVPDQAATPGQAPPDATAAPGKNDETTWRKRFAAQRERIARAEKELEILQREESKAQLQYYNDPQKALAQQYTRQDINDKAARIAAKKKEIDDLNRELSDLEDQLRKSGGDSGWSRP